MKLESLEVESVPAFVYDSPSWGEGWISPAERSPSGRKLSYCLRDLTQVQGRVLEIGCARGQFIRSVKRHRPELQAYGFDINTKAIQLNRLEEDGVAYLVGDASQLPFPDQFFDAVVAFDVLEHFEIPLQLLREIRRILKRDGLFHAYVPCEGEPWTMYWFLWKLRLGSDLKRKHRGHIQRFAFRSCLRLIEDAELVVVKKYFSGYLLEQLLDLFFYVSLEWHGVRQALWKAHALKPGLKGEEVQHSFLRWLSTVKRAFFAFDFYETKLLSPLKEKLAFGLHVTAKR